uniref:Putative secreted peptide n=1 Tax=Anopheles braziliensis TaxID=58242 RepID=A0A2M3ZQA3_9DIPT
MRFLFSIRLLFSIRSFLLLVLNHPSAPLSHCFCCCSVVVVVERLTVCSLRVYHSRCARAGRCSAYGFCRASSGTEQTTTLSNTHITLCIVQAGSDTV